MGLQENLKTETIGQLNLRPAVTVTGDETVASAVEKMRAAGLGCVIVVDGDGKAVGMYTEAMLRNEILNSREFLSHPLSQEMASQFPWLAPTDPIETLLDAMQTNNTRFVAVLDEDRKVIALTGQKGLMEYVAEHFPQEVMCQYVGPHAADSEREGA